MAGKASRSRRAAEFIVSACIAATTVAIVSPSSAQQFVVPSQARSIIFNETNAYRAEHGLPPLRLSPNASIVAAKYAKYLGSTGKQGHRADGRSPRDRLKAHGMDVCHVWENWHKWTTFGSRASVEDAMAQAMAFWKQSPGHARSMRAPAREIGIGVIGWKRGNRWVYTQVQLFLDRTCLKGRLRPKENPFPERPLP